MNFKIDKSFEKDIDKLTNAKLRQNIAKCINQVSDAESLKFILNIKKLAGFKDHYRIRLGDYRIGLLVRNNEIIFERFLHRKEIYKFYP